MPADHQTSRQMAAIVLASAALAVSGPAWSQAGAQEVMFEERAVVQEIPGAPAKPVVIEVERIEMGGGETEGHAPRPVVPTREYTWHQAPEGHRPVAPAMAHGAGHMMGQSIGVPVYFPQGAYPAGAMNYPAGVQQDGLAREQWLEECRARYSSGKHRRDGRREVPSECEAFLARHDARWQQMSYGYGPVMLVPIMVPVEQRAVVREYVTEEWVEKEEVVSVPGKKIIQAVPAPQAVKTIPIKTIPIKTIPIKTRAVKSVK